MSIISTSTQESKKNKTHLGIIQLTNHTDLPTPQIKPDTPPREIFISKTGSQPIHGAFPLYDELSLTTVAGNISATIYPQPARRSHPHMPARVRIRSGSGSIQVSFAAPASISAMSQQKPQPQQETEKEEEEWSHACGYTSSHAQCSRDQPQANIFFFESLPSRHYEVDIETDSGSISGIFVFSSHIRLVTRINNYTEGYNDKGEDREERVPDGSINALLIPFISDTTALPPCSHSLLSYSDGTRNTSASILTQTGSGNQSIRLADPVTAFEGSNKENKRNKNKSETKRFAYLSMWTLSPFPFPFSKTETAAVSPPPAVASHISSSAGNLNITYPGLWTGHVRARSGLVLSDEAARISGLGMEVVNASSHSAFAQRYIGQREKKKKRSASAGTGWWGSRGDMDVSVWSGRGHIVFHVE
ncbi:hypothetical protein NUU61_009102 [Penicillium alfredii]|uniref:Uncharacterized protein n=1 Tax=Penicillium alfredii TaxID=1506179 RepID=A0A9W9JWU5_9EURO|nr:uncharacterized protein NUU61_009102 [Penicillium alfredii]KAJ5084523.1 hypothetical protein NUU61_009102 [Penicillium alfredii]